MRPLLRLVLRVHPGIFVRIARFSERPAGPFDPTQEANALIEFIDAAAGSHMHSNAAAHGNLHEVNMPKLDAIYLRGLAHAAFITHQKMANCGIYSA
jgi:hypothetical protein